MKRPKCINPGCGTFATPSAGRVGEYGVRYRIHCSPCHKNSYDPDNYPLKEGITRYKKHICSNTDGHLGFPCVINWKLAQSAGLKVKTEVDHKNGDHTDDRPDNLQELCQNCHGEKGKRNGDYNGYR